MLRRVLVLITLIAVVPSAAIALPPDPIFPGIFEDFESYADGAGITDRWPLLPPGAPPTGPIIPATVTSDDALFPGIQGKAAAFDFLINAGAIHGMLDESLSFFMTPGPAEFVVFSADIFDDGVSIFKRFTAGTRFINADTPGQAINVVQMGYPFPPLPLAHRQLGVLLNTTPAWQPFSLPEDMNESQEIGQAWHRFTAFISMDQIIYQLDLHRDGTLDAIDVVGPPVLVNPMGFNEVRFGIMGVIPIEPGRIAIDNISLQLVPIPEPGGWAFIAGGTGAIGCAIAVRRKLPARGGVKCVAKSVRCCPPPS